MSARASRRFSMLCLQNKCSEVGMRRTTAGVNLFHIHTKGTRATKDSLTVGIKATKSGTEIDPIWNPETKEIHTPDQALRQITRDNQEFRSVKTVQETSFHVELDDPICDMRPDTEMVLIDIPGLNEAGSKDMYRDYVKAKWDTFDCIIVVMDVNQGVNTEEEVQLLEMVRANMKEGKKPPVIVLCNKVEDPDNKEVMGLVKEVSQKVDLIFKDLRASAPPVVFVPISAENAFVYRTASWLSFEEFQKLDESLIDKIVCEEVGRSKWRKLSDAARQETAYLAVSDKSNYEGNLKATNFLKFLDELNLLTGENVQRWLIHKQTVVTLEALTFEQVVADELEKVYNINARVGLPQDILSCAFWVIYGVYSVQSFASYKADVNHSRLQVAMNQLIAYDAFAKIHIPSDYHEEHTKVVDALESIVSEQINLLVKHANDSTWLISGRYVTEPLYDWSTTEECWTDVTGTRNTRLYCYDQKYNDNDDRGYRSHSSRCDKFGNSLPAKSPLESLHFNHLVVGGHHSHGSRDGKLARRLQKEEHPLKSNAHHWSQVSGGWKNKYTGSYVAGEHNPVSGKLAWKKLSPLDFVTMSQSILLVSYSRAFCTTFGREKVQLKKIVSDYVGLIQRLDPKFDEISGRTSHTTEKAHRIRTMLCEFTKGEYDDKGSFVPQYPDKYPLVAQIAMPQRLSDPKHWGHVAWQYCEFMNGSSTAADGRHAEVVL